MHEERTKVDLTELSEEFESFLKKHPEFESGDDRIDDLRAEILEKSKKEEQWLEELNTKYTEWVQIIDANEKKIKLAELLGQIPGIHI